MEKVKTIGWRALWALFMLVTLAGCGALKGFGRGLGDVMGKFKMP